MGWCPPGTSMMLRRRIPRARLGTRGSSKRKPSPSGPRCIIAAVMARTQDWARILGEVNATPQMPHTLLFNLRRMKEGCAGAQDVAPETIARKTQAVVGVPGQQQAQQEKENERNQGDKHKKERLALQEQAPVQIFVPRRVDFSKQAVQPEGPERKPGNANMHEI